MVFLIHTELRCTVNHTSSLQLFEKKHEFSLRHPVFRRGCFQYLKQIIFSLRFESRPKTKFKVLCRLKGYEKHQDYQRPNPDWNPAALPPSGTQHALPETLLKVNFTLSTPWRHRGAAEVQLHSFWISALDEVGGQLQALATLPTRKNPGRQSIRGWVRHRVRLRVLEKRKISCPC